MVLFDYIRLLCSLRSVAPIPAVLHLCTLAVCFASIEPLRIHSRSSFLSLRQLKNSESIQQILRTSNLLTSTCLSSVRYFVVCTPMVLVFALHCCCPNGWEQLPLRLGATSSCNCRGTVFFRVCMLARDYATGSGYNLEVPQGTQGPTQGHGRRLAHSYS